MPDEGSSETLKQAVDRIVAGLLRVPQKQKLEYLKQEIAKLPADQRDPAETLLLQTEAILAKENPVQRWEKIATFAFGVSFVVVLLLIAVLVPRPTEFQIFVFRVVLALAGAGVGALIPGFLNIESKVRRNSLRAGGALALFVIIYLINPPALVTGH